MPCWRGRRLSGNCLNRHNMYNSNFQLKRVGRLCWLDLWQNYPRHLLILAGLLAFSFLVFTALEDSDQFKPGAIPTEIGLLKFHLTFFPALLLGGGAIFTSLAFRELSSKSSRCFYLVLPASALEKCLSKWLLSALVFPVVLLALYQLFLPFTYAEMAESGFRMVRMPFFDPWAWLWIGIYILAKSAVFMGAVAWPRYSLLKTLFLIGAIALAIGLVHEVIVYYLVPWFSEDTRAIVELARKQKTGVDLTEPYRLNWLNRLPGRLILVFACCITPLLLVTGYFKLREKEG
jgi:hypothetical protein